MTRIPVALAPREPVERADVEFGERTRRPPGSGLRVALVGFQDQDNLGLRYLQSAASHYGHDCTITSFGSEPDALVSALLAIRPDVVGLSLIFQYMAPTFAEVVQTLRSGGFTGHVTIGGHYPSFDPEEVLRRMPGLDSVVRFEGEATFIELLHRLENQQSWHDLAGLARRDERGDPVTNELRASIEDLDVLPFPDRRDVSYESQELPTASMLASRGCPWNCSFCSIRPFYEAPGGALRRLRDPLAVVREMEHLHLDRGVVAFLFQDDDFMAIGRRGKSWAVSLADAIFAGPMRGRISMKISCRSDEVDEDTFRILRDRGGLTHVYLGVESGDPITLEHLRKQLRPESHLKAADVFRKLGLSFDFGYMVLEPYSTFDAVRSGVEFLDRFVGDGWTVATFCRTLPYAGTPLKLQLEREGRLLGTAFDPDYEFLDTRLDVFYDWMLYTFRRRNFTDVGLCHMLRALQFELHLRVDGRRLATDMERATGRYLVSIANRIATSTLLAALAHCESSTFGELRTDPSYLLALASQEHAEEVRLEADVIAFYERFRASVGLDTGALVRNELPGGFERTWTLDHS